MVGHGFLSSWKLLRFHKIQGKRGPSPISVGGKKIAVLSEVNMTTRKLKQDEANDLPEAKKNKAHIIYGEPLICSPSDTKSYRSMEIRSNGLTAVLISAPTTTNAAVAVSLNVGNSHDPEEAQGLCHLLEHMLFLGSTKYPQKTGFSEFLAKYGGESNASTSPDKSSFYVHIGSGNLEEALERFSHFFISPLLDQKFIEEEMLIIDSEFEESKIQDNFRLNQLRVHTSEEASPYQRFGCGNKESLSKPTIHELQRLLTVFFNQHYIGSSMKLCVLGSETLSELEDWIVKYFSGVRGRSESIPTLSRPPIPIWDASRYYISEGVEGRNHITLSWKIPASETSYKEKPELYPLLLLRKANEGSLCVFLKDNRLVFGDIIVSCDEDSLSDRCFELSLSLTALGKEKHHEIITHVYRYISAMREKELQESLLSDYWKMKEKEFECLNIVEFEFVKALSVNMLKYPLRHVLSGDYVNQQWMPRSVKQFLELLTPDNMRIDLVTVPFDTAAGEIKTEPRCNIRYREEKIPQDVQWKNISPKDFATYLPSKNRFTQSAFTPRPVPLDEIPEIISSKPLVQWWLQREEVPTTVVFFYIKLNTDFQLEENQMMLSLFVELQNAEQSDLRLEGEEADLSYSLTLQREKLKFRFQGYGEKLKDFITEIWNKFTGFSLVLEQFEVIKDKERNHLNYMSHIDHSDWLKEQVLYCQHGSSGSVESLNVKVSPKDSRVDAKLTLLESITFQDLQSFIHGVQSSEMYVEGFCYGNVLRDEAMDIKNIIGRKVENLTAGKFHLEKLRFGVRKKDIRIDEVVRRETDKNSVALLYFRIGKAKVNSVNRVADCAKLDVLNAMIKGKVFDQLRTREQLCYTPQCFTEFIGGGEGLDSVFVCLHQDMTRIICWFE